MLFPRTHRRRRLGFLEHLEQRRLLTSDPIVLVNTNLGSFQIELLPSAAPQTVQNFLSYVDSGAYSDTIFHRSHQPSPSQPGDIGIVQAGGFTSPSTTYTNVSQFQTISTKPPIPLEYNLPNAVGTVAMARTGDPSTTTTATDQFFINNIDNSTTLGAGNSGGYAVFGKVLGNGMQIVNQIAALPITAAASPFNELPLGQGNQLVRINSMAVINVSGTVFTDANGNGQLDSGETGIAGRTVFLDKDGTGQPDNNNPSVTTDANGNFTFTGVSPGPYTVKEVLPSGAVLTTAAQPVTVAADQTVASVVFGEAPPSITGTVFSDTNDNGQLDSGESGVSGRTVFLNKDGSGHPDPTNLSVTTGSDGKYTFFGLPAGPYTVQEVLPSGTTLSTPARQVTVTAGATSGGVDFGEAPSIIGMVFNDLNVNGTFDSGDKGLPGRTVFLNIDGSGQPSTQNVSTTTDANGNFSFSGLAAGGYTVEQVVTADHGVTVTTPVQTVTVASGQRTPHANIGDVLTSTLAPLPVSVATGTPSSDGNTAYIDALFHDLLGRTADATSLAYYQSQLSGGASREHVALAMWNSPEHRALEIDQFYHTYLNRAADPQGKAYFLSAFTTWGTERLVVATFLSSAEYSRLHASNTDFTTALYQDVDLRAPDTAGLNSWQTALGNGQTRLQAAFGFIDSAEANGEVVDSYYGNVLHRAADSASRQNWVNLLSNKTLSIEDVGAKILATDEFFALAGRAS
jgi:cyclophilin family peptidyl-prolyl cis-trans isomerase